MIECVPNVSEGRDPEIISRIADAIVRADCRLLDVHSDPDHNRSVYTIVGEAEQIEYGAVALAESATALVDLAAHCGVHPRIGAVDVIPFIPLGSTPMSKCVDVARNVGRTLGKHLDLPVFLYGAATQSRQRMSLPGIRRGGMKALARRLNDTPPDFGPWHLHPTSGAVAIGARPLLVAFNVVLDTNDIAAARAIAAAMREVNGGLPGVKALGFALASRGLVQVSMNLTQVPRNEDDIARPTLPRVFQYAESEASHLGIAVLESELVGLVPKAALADGTAASLRMREDPCKRILEVSIGESLP